MTIRLVCPAVACPLLSPLGGTASSSNVLPPLSDGCTTTPGGFPGGNAGSPPRTATFDKPDEITNSLGYDERSFAVQQRQVKKLWKT